MTLATVIGNKDRFPPEGLEVYFTNKAQVLFTKDDCFDENQVGYGCKYCKHFSLKRFTSFSEPQFFLLVCIQKRSHNAKRSRIAMKLCDSKSQQNSVMMK